jgi:hypothetical protein
MPALEEEPMADNWEHAGLGEPRQSGYFDFSQWGTVRGKVRNADGQLPGECTIWQEPTTPPADGIPAILNATSSDGSYDLYLPAATYTIGAQGETSTGTTLSGKVVGVVITGGAEITVDITVTAEPD